MRRASAILAALIVSACGRLGFDRLSDPDAGPPADAGIDASPRDAGEATPDADGPDAGEPDATVPPNAVVEVRAGGYTTCARLGSGDIYCWGYGGLGNLGDGTFTIAAPTPVRAATTAPSISLETNDPGSCVRAEPGRVACWGDNTYGMFGSGVVGRLATPTPVLDVDDAVDVALAFSAMCVVRASGRVSCAGEAFLLGDGSTMNRPTLGDVPDVVDAHAITAGDDHVCALRSSGAVTCWGANDSGQLGDGTMTDSKLPTVGPIGPYRQLASGDSHVCAVRSDAPVVECWGENSSGSLGDGTTVSRSVPVRVALGFDAASVASGSAFSCALSVDGAVACWGVNDFGQLGDGTAPADRPTPGLVPLTNVVEVTSRTAQHACARTADGAVFCWGVNDAGQVGTGTVSPSSAIPVRVIGLP